MRWYSRLADTEVAGLNSSSQGQAEQLARTVGPVKLRAQCFIDQVQAHPDGTQLLVHIQLQLGAAAVIGAPVPP